VLATPLLLLILRRLLILILRLAQARSKKQIAAQNALANKNCFLLALGRIKKRKTLSFGLASALRKEEFKNKKKSCFARLSSLGAGEL
jgi:hypothetical protein